MEFDSLHSYLDYCFSGKKSVSDSMIMDAKKQYRKRYLSKYHTKYREKYTQISFRISKKQHKVFKKLAKKNKVKTTFYIKQLLLKSQSPSSHLDLKTLNLLLLQAIDISEEAIQENTVLDSLVILSLLEKIQKNIQ